LFCLFSTGLGTKALSATSQVTSRYVFCNWYLIYLFI